MNPMRFEIPHRPYVRLLQIQGQLMIQVLHYTYINCVSFYFAEYSLYQETFQIKVTYHNKIYSLFHRIYQNFTQAMLARGA
jgi:hypothetical protein